MPKLILSRGETIVDQCWIEDTRITIGRAKGNRISVEDPAVGDSHASISAVGHDYILEDLRGMALTVNGTPTRRRILQHNDVVALGAFNLRYVDSKSSSEIDLERTMLIPGLKLFPDKRPQDLDVTQNLHVPSSRAAAASFPSGRVKFLNGVLAGKTKVLDRVIATFGEPGRGVVVLTRRPKGYYATHVEGDALPRVNGESIGKEPRHLHSGDRVEIAGVEFEFSLDQ
jgi:pSer/pThr/pTyr-binding forkhead associated (FHA) protein